MRSRLLFRLVLRHLVLLLSPHQILLQFFEFVLVDLAFGVSSFCNIEWGLITRIIVKVTAAAKAAHPAVHDSRVATCNVSVSSVPDPKATRPHTASQGRTLHPLGTMPLCGLAESNPSSIPMSYSPF